MKWILPGEAGFHLEIIEENWASTHRDWDFCFSECLPNRTRNLTVFKIILNHWQIGEAVATEPDYLLLRVRKWFFAYSDHFLAFCATEKLQEETRQICLFEPWTAWQFSYQFYRFVSKLWATTTILQSVLESSLKSSLTFDAFQSIKKPCFSELWNQSCLSPGGQLAATPVKSDPTHGWEFHSYSHSRASSLQHRVYLG